MTVQSSKETGVTESGPTSLRAVSYGGGVQSTALLVLAAQRRIDFPLFLMANVGDDSEHPATLDYVRRVAQPYASAQGIELVVLERIKRDGTAETVWSRVMREGSTSQTIPVYLGNGMPGSRSCTVDFKVKVTGRELKRRGATAESPATVGIGISVDEIHRANNRRTLPHERIVYPLLDLRLRRDDCMRIIREAGLPIPPKSSCFFCPFHRAVTWQDMARDEPHLFEMACQLEETLNARQDSAGKPHVHLTRFGQPLRTLFRDDAPVLPFDLGDGTCDSGWCMT